MRDLVIRDLKHIWHPCSQMKDYEQFQPLEIIRAEGSYFELKQGRKVIDAISSWWCKSLGHNHPRLKQALINQTTQFEHVILANTTNKTIVELAERLAKLSPGLNKIMFAGDGSSAVEIALKMSLHARQISGEQNRSRFVALTNAFHGETVGCLSVSDLGLYRDAYQKLLFDVDVITPPYVAGEQDPLWQNCAAQWLAVEKQLDPIKDSVTAIIVEPILQAAGQMKIYSQDFLKRLRAFTKKNNIHLIADEIMTGFGRTGKMLACEHADMQPDFLCLAKGLTAGWLPMSVMMTHDHIYELFYADYTLGRNFMHSHTHSGNALAAAIAIEVLKISEEEQIAQRAQQLGVVMHKAFTEVAVQTGKLQNVRSIGAMVAGDLIVTDSQQRGGYAVFQEAIKLGAWLRPLGNTIYWTPPLNTSFDTIAELKNITQAAIATALLYK